MVDALDSKSSSSRSVRSSRTRGTIQEILLSLPPHADMLPRMDKRTDSTQATAAELEQAVEHVAVRRDRLLASLTLIAGIGVIVGLPFALRAGAEFFLPVTAALVIAIALVPMLEWLERRRVPSPLAAFISVLVFLGAANVAVASIVLPASDWVRMLPERIGRIRETLAPVMKVYSQLQRFIDDLVRQFGPHSRPSVRTVAVEQPNSLLDIIATSAPHAAIQMFFALLVV